MNFVKRESFGSVLGPAQKGPKTRVLLGVPKTAIFEGPL
jgi:hypothetical protein